MTRRKYASGADSIVMPTPGRTTADAPRCTRRSRVTAPVSTRGSPPDGSRVTITFSPDLGDLPALRAFDTRLLVDGNAGADQISVQSIDQPTYVQGGDGEDTLNVNVEIVISGPLPGSLPDGLDVIPPAKAVAGRCSSPSKRSCRWTASK